MTTSNRCTEKVYESEISRPLLDLLPRRRGRVLDCGCGDGYSARVLSERGFNVTGITISLSEQQAALRYCDQVYLHDLESGAPAQIQGSYDVILMSHVLEHLVRPERLLRDAGRLLAPDGILAVALPNALHFENRFRLLLGKCEYTEEGIMDETHVRFYSYTTGRRLLESNGFIVTHAIADGWVPLWVGREMLQKRTSQYLDSLACSWCPGLFGYQFFYLAKLSTGTNPLPPEMPAAEHRGG